MNVPSNVLDEPLEIGLGKHKLMLSEIIQHREYGKDTIALGEDAEHVHGTAELVGDAEEDFIGTHNVVNFHGDGGCVATVDHEVVQLLLHHRDGC